MQRVKTTQHLRGTKRDDSFTCAGIILANSGSLHKPEHKGLRSRLVESKE